MNFIRSFMRYIFWKRVPISKGEIWVMNPTDPFDPTCVKVIDIKSGYVQFAFLDKDGQLYQMGNKYSRKQSMFVAMYQRLETP